MVYRTGPEATAPAPPRKWPHRVIVGVATFVWLAFGFMTLVDFGAHVDGPGVGYGTGILGALVLSSIGAFIVALVGGIRWPWSRLVGWLSGMVLAIAFIGARMPIRILHLRWALACDGGDGAACHGLGDEIRGCKAFYWPSCDRLIGTPDQQIACDSLQMTCWMCVAAAATATPAVPHPCPVPGDVCDRLSQTCPPRR